MLLKLKNTIPRYHIHLLLGIRIRQIANLFLITSIAFSTYTTIASVAYTVITLGRNTTVLLLHIHPFQMRTRLN